MLWDVCKTCNGTGRIKGNAYYRSMTGEFCIICRGCRGEGRVKVDGEEQVGYGKRMEAKVEDWIRYRWKMPNGNVCECRGKIESIIPHNGYYKLEKYDGEAYYRVVHPLDIIKVEGINMSDPARTTFVSVEKEDMVNSPKHYIFGKIEVITVIDDWQLGFYEGQVIKYVGRAKHKGNELEDLRKAQWYLNRKIKQLSDEVISVKEK